ncbi:MAG: cell division control protein 6, partial [Methanomethylophilus sp.]
ALDMNHKIALLAVSRCMKGMPSISSTAAEKTYRVVCEEYEVPARRHTQFASYISDLARDGLVRTEVRREEEGGRAMYIIIDDIPPRELAKKLEYLIETDQLAEEKRRAE